MKISSLILLVCLPVSSFAIEAKEAQDGKRYWKGIFKGDAPFSTPHIHNVTILSEVTYDYGKGFLETKYIRVDGNFKPVVDRVTLRRKPDGKWEQEYTDPGTGKRKLGPAELVFDAAGKLKSLKMGRTYASGYKYVSTSVFDATKSTNSSVLTDAKGQKFLTTTGNQYPVTKQAYDKEVSALKLPK